jgi:hypothetical protein
MILVPCVALKADGKPCGKHAVLIVHGKCYCPSCYPDTPEGKEYYAKHNLQTRIERVRKVFRISDYSFKRTGESK